VLFKPILVILLNNKRWLKIRLTTWMKLNLVRSNKSKKEKELKKMIMVRDPKYSEDESPRWSYWSQFKFISLEDAIYLSLNINPHMLRFMLQEVKDFYCQEIDERKEVAYNWADSLNWYFADIDDVSSRDKVDLILFASWVCNQMKWDVPQEFKKITSLNQNSLSQTEDSQKIVSTKELSNNLKLIGALYEIIIQKNLHQSDEALKNYLEAEYGHFGGFSRRTLDSKLSAAKKAISYKT